ncbi:MAG TPA: hypothetical protein VNU97_00700 [Rhizomicrobium sp.]|jgi:hypothetical protein|nr:hypothetical protein [Rhizomicrobium sp.]
MAHGGYRDAWQDLRRRILIFWLASLLFVLGVPLAVVGLNQISPGLGDSASGWIIGGVVVVILVAWFYRFSFRCPKCGGWYFSTDSWSSTFARKCLHCGLPRNAESE